MLVRINGMEVSKIRSEREMSNLTDYMMSTILNPTFQLVGATKEYVDEFVKVERNAKLMTIKQFLNKEEFSEMEYKVNNFMGNTSGYLTAAVLAISGFGIIDLSLTFFVEFLPVIGDLLNESLTAYRPIGGFK